MSARHAKVRKPIETRTEKALGPERALLLDFLKHMANDGLIRSRLVPSNHDEWDHSEGNQVLVASYESEEDMVDEYLRSRS